MYSLTAAAQTPTTEVTMHNQESRELGELGPEEVGARVSAILEAAERDARAVIAAAYREQGAPPQPEGVAQPEGVEDLARELARLEARVEALEHAVGAQPPAPAPPPAAEAAAEVAARVQAVELALAGLPREAIARELSRTLDAAAVERLLDDVLQS